MKVLDKIKELLGPVMENKTFRTWVSRVFIISIVVYLIVIGYLVAEAVKGASKWAPYGVSIPAFVGLVISSEIIITVTGAWVFKEDSGIWPPTISAGWKKLRSGKVVKGVCEVLAGAWSISIIDLRLRTSKAILMGRTNRIAALVPLSYALIASYGKAPWGLRSSALIDIVITLAVWLLMELVMVRPEDRRTKFQARSGGSE